MHLNLSYCKSIMFGRLQTRCRFCQQTVLKTVTICDVTLYRIPSYPARTPCNRVWSSYQLIISPKISEDSVIVLLLLRNMFMYPRFFCFRLFIFYVFPVFFLDFYYEIRKVFQLQKSAFQDLIVDLLLNYKAKELVKWFIKRISLKVVVLEELAHSFTAIVQCQECVGTWEINRVQNCCY